MATTRSAIYIGIRGTVLALDPNTGIEIWRTNLNGSDFVNIVLEGDRVLATTKGEVYCLDSTTGQMQWNNELKGLGRGLVTMATPTAPFGSVLPSAEKRRRDEEAAAAASTTGVVTS
ncbi:MAG: PQQ-binding-like beta-propeller repeat protein [Bryobacteraceae bacterium]